MARKNVRGVDPWNICDCWQECPYECDGGVCEGYGGGIIIPPTKEDLAGKLLALKEQKGQLEEQIKQINSEISMTEDLIIQDMLTEEIDRFKAHDVFFYWKYDTFANVNKTNTSRVIAWLRLNGFSELIITEIDKKGLVKAVEEMLAVSDELPSGLGELVNVYEKPIIRTRKSAKKGE